MLLFYLFYYVVSNGAILFICILNIFYDGEVNTYIHTIFFKHLRVLLSFCLIFCQLQLGVAFKSVAYKKGMYTSNSIQDSLLQ